MSNYGEELAYWYLRLNGFFPITNFVIHRDNSTPRAQSSDAGVLAVRPPHVSERIGGQPADWDPALREICSNFRPTVGIICEVKTGKTRNLFGEKNVRYAVSRLGFEDISEYSINDFLSSKTMSINPSYEVSKLLIANKRPRQHGRFHFISMEAVHDFIKDRMLRYTDEKHSARMFFNSNLIQTIIWEAEREQQRQRNGRG